jgi:hypothetical protein
VDEVLQFREDECLAIYRISAVPSASQRHGAQRERLGAVTSGTLCVSFGAPTHPARWKLEPYLCGHKYSMLVQAKMEVCVRQL